MGEVYRAVLQGIAGFQKLVALKVLFPFGADTENMRRDLIKEAKIGAMLHHPNIVETYELGEEQGRLFIAMELLEGPNLRNLIQKDGALPPRVCLDILIGIAQGLHYAHTRTYDGSKLHLIHRDIKPSNILIAMDGTPKIADFGLAKATGLTDHTEVGIRGTPAYMSPEQVLGEPLTPASDLFSLGLVLYEMLTGERIFAHLTPLVAMLKMPEIDVHMTEEMWSDVEEKSRELSGVLRKLLCRDLENRFNSAQELHRSLRNLSIKGPDLISLLRNSSSIRNESVAFLAESETELLIPRGPILDVMVGKDGLVRKIHRRLMKNRSVLIKGLPGFGKSLLLQHLLAYANERGDEVYFVDLKGVETSKEAKEYLALALSQSELFLSDFQNALFIVDGGTVALEKVFLSWLRKTPTCSWVFSSRASLGNLPIEEIALEPLSIEASVELFQTLLPDQTNFSSGEDFPFLKWANKLEGNPYLITQMVRRLIGDIESKDVSELIKESREDWFELLREALAYDPLCLECIQQLAIFEGPFSIEAAQSVVSIDSENTIWVMDLIAQLLDRSFLHQKQRHTQDIHKEERFVLSRNMRRFAISLPLSSDAHVELKLRHARWFAQWSVISIRLGVDSYMNRRQEEERNLHRAFKNSVLHGWNDLALQNGLALAEVWYRRGPLHKGLSLLEKLLHLEDIGQRDLASVQVVYGNYLRHLGKYEKSASLLKAAQKIYVELEDELGKILVFRNLGLTYLDDGDAGAGLRLLQQSELLCVRLEESYQHLLVQKEKGYLLSQIGRLKDAEQLLRDVAHKMIPFEDSFSLWQIYSNLGLIAFRQENPFEAIRYFQRCLQYGQQVNLSDSMGIVLMNMGLCHLLTGEISAAERSFHQSSQRLQKMGNYRALAMLHANMAMLRMTQKRYKSSQKYVLQAQNLDKRFGHPMTFYTYSLVESFLFAEQNQPSLALLKAKKAFHGNFSFSRVKKKHCPSFCF